ncbi:MAG: phospholipase A, partial [Arcobacteraceae bacterium]
MFKQLLTTSLLTTALFAQDPPPLPKEKYSFSIMSHHQNFLLFAGHTNNTLIEKQWHSNGTRDYEREYERKKNEIQFQLSIKLPLYNNIFDTGADFFAAYTQQSFWQIYDTDNSAPFRETNYSPEFFLEWQPDTQMGSSTLKHIRLSLIHQSNGQEIGPSRSWNRTEVSVLMQNNNISYGMTAWDRWQEDKKEDISQAEGDDNPDLEEFIGKQKVFISYENDDYKLSLTHQNNLFNYDINKGNTIVDFT